MIGGLGNQLFILAAAMSHSNRGYDTIINSGNLKFYGSSHGNSIEQMSFDGELPKIQNLGNSLNSILFRTCNFFNKYLYFQNLPFWKINRPLGFADLNHNAKTKIHHLGYFQSWKFLSDEIKDILCSMEPLQQSSGYRALHEFAIIEKPIIIHLRRGDYLFQSDTLGVLSEEYYLAAIQELKIKMPDSTDYWIISEDEQVAHQLAAMVNGNVRVISSGSGLSDIEILALMKLGQAHIIANSTYSWWGAYLARNSNVVVAPSPWFRNLDAPIDLIPDSWFQLKSLWL